MSDEEWGGNGVGFLASITNGSWPNGTPAHIDQMDDYAQRVKNRIKKSMYDMYDCKKCGFFSKRVTEISESPEEVTVDRNKQDNFCPVCTYCILSL